MTRDRHSVPLDARLCSSQDRQVGLRWPVALDRRLDDLLDRAEDAGERTNRRELIAALLLAAEYDGDELRELLRTYRTALVRDAPLATDVEDGNVLKFEPPSPGPRPRKSHQES